MNKLFEGKKGRNNKLNINDVVEVKKDCIKWFVEHAVENYSIGGNGEISSNHLSDVASWFHSYLKKKPIKGIIIGYGNGDYSKKGNCLKNKNNVLVFLKGEYCNLSSYLSERNLKRIK